jgi:HD-GYP domain-containing protein (c-di-GMP phosphodiesterase class II)
MDKLILPDVTCVTDNLPSPGTAQSTLQNPIANDVRPTQLSSAATLLRQQSGCSEIGRAIDLLNNMSLSLAKLHRAARRKQSLELQRLKRDIDALIDNFAVEPNTLFWALAANRRMYHLSRRSVGCAVWALAFGCHLDFNREELHELMLGATLLDIGKINVPIVILAKGNDLNDAERKFVRRHVVDSVGLLRSAKGLSEATLEMVRSHHERIDGSGYPFGLQGDEISLYGQIAGIVDSYDAMSVSRYYAEGLSGHAALSTLRKERGTKFDAELVDQFISAVGEFPTGTWVEFKDGCTGVVCSQDPADPADPKAAQVAMIADANQQPFLAVRWLSLHKHNEVRMLPPKERPAHAPAMERSLQAAIYARRPRKF